MPVEYRTTRCSACKETFQYRYNTDSVAGDSLIIKTTCPYCHAKLSINLNPYTRRSVPVLRTAGNEGAPASETETLELPDEIPTALRED